MPITCSKAILQGIVHPLDLSDVLASLARERLILAFEIKNWEVLIYPNPEKKFELAFAFKDLLRPLENQWHGRGPKTSKDER